MTSRELKEIRQSIIAGNDIDFKILEVYGISPTYKEHNIQEIDIYGFGGDVYNYKKVYEFIKPYQLEKPRYKTARGHLSITNKPFKIEIEHVKTPRDKQKQIICN